MRRLDLLAVLVSAAACAAAAQPATSSAAPDNNPPGVGVKVALPPSVAIVVGIFTMVLSLTFILLVYAKFCHPSSSSSSNQPPDAAAAAPTGQEVAGGGVPKAVVESLPFFRFATLRGERQGLECSVCLARFDDADLLRLLPRCSHAFHLDCVDRWLHSNDTCPLCRTIVSADDASLGFKYAASARVLLGGSARFDGGGDHDDGRDLLDIFVERVPSSRSLGHGLAGTEAKEGEQRPPRKHTGPGSELDLDRHRHRIVVSDAVFKNRWSELNSADLIALDTEIMSGGGRFFPPSPGCISIDIDINEAKPSSSAEDEDAAAVRKRLLGGGSSNTAITAVSASSVARMISSSGCVRSVSEIVSLPRRKEEVPEQERRWLPIARRTARWFAGRANGNGEEEERGAVHVAAAHV